MSDFRLPHLASQLDIEQWAGRNVARSALPKLARRLITELVPTVTELTMEGDEHTDFGGYDGIVTSPIKTPFVPEGRSIWEFGVSGDPRGKAEKDYKKRTEEPLGVEPSDTTFVFVTPRSWAGGHDWAREKASRGEWKDVVVRTSGDLYAALELSPGTHIWFSEEIGIPSNSVITLSTWWDRYSNNTSGLMVKELIMAGRERDRKELLSRILDAAGSHNWIEAPSTDDVLAFVAAAIQSAEPDIGQVLMERALVVFEPGALMFLSNTENLLILVPFEESLIRHADLVSGHHVVMHTTTEGKATFRLSPISIGAAEKVLEELGVEYSRRRKLSQAINKSLPLYKQELTGTTNTALALATEIDTSSITLRRLWLLGSWNMGQSGDTQILEQMTGNSTTQIIHEIDELTKGPAPFLAKVGGAWRIFDLAQGFTSLAANFSHDDFKAFEKAVQEVLGAVDPRLDLPMEDRWKASLEGKQRPHSTELRRGIARTLAFLGSREQVVSSGATSYTGKSWAQLLTRAVLQRANQDASGKVWESVLDVLSLLAEAAPDIYMKELEAAIGPKGPLRGRIFTDAEETFFSRSSPHTHLLWSLETLAWSAAYFGASTNLLMTLAEQDPGGKLSNRPLRSLAYIFSPWHPQTEAPLRSRNAVLSKHVRKGGDVVWQLLLSLLPDSHAVVMENSGPEFHEWKSRVLESKVSMASYVEGVAHVVRLCSNMAKGRSDRLLGLIEKLDDLPPDLRAELLSVFEEFAESRPSAEESEAIWKQLTSLIRRHRRFKDAQWSLNEASLAEIEAVAGRLEPADLTERVEWLFDYHPDLDGLEFGDEGYDLELNRRQVAAAESIARERGLDGLTDLARKVKNPWSLGYAVGASQIEVDLEELASYLADDKSLCEFSTASLRKRLEDEPGKLLEFAKQTRGNELVSTRLLLMVDDLSAAWQAAKDLGEDVDEKYWEEFTIFGRGPDFSLVNECALELAHHRRLAAALDLLAIYSHGAESRVDARLVAELLSNFTTTPVSELGALSQYDIVSLVDYVKQADVLTVEELGLLEWRLLPILGSTARVESLQSLLATSPEFFVDVLGLLYKRRSDQDEGVPNDDDKAKSLAKNAWDLLHRWTMIPGSVTVGGEIDEDGMKNWIHRARELLAVADLLDVGEAHIGQVLAHSIPDGDIWPTLAVRNFLDDDSTDVIDRNFLVGIYNKRGVTSRGVMEGGDQERAIASQYDDYAALVTDEWPKTARLLRAVADDYRREATRNDEEARRLQEGFDL